MTDRFVSPESTHPVDESPTPALNVVVDLIEALNRSGISYCHWKSNEAIARSMSAENDLDLLVDRGDAPQLNAVLGQFGFKNAQTSKSRHVPGMVDHYMMHAASGRMVHVQAHYQLVLGDDMTKNFRLPIEGAYLASCAPTQSIPVPDPSFEFLVFVLRMVVKHCPLDAQAARKGRLGLSERRELVFLTERADPIRVEALRAEHTPYVSAALLALCQSAVAPDASRLVRARAGRALLGALQPLSRDQPTQDLALRVWRRFRRRLESGKPASRRRLDSGGMVVSIVGGDGSGKSSAVAHSYKVFSRHFPTHKVHLGKPQRSLSTRVFARGLRWWRRLTRTPRPVAMPWTDWTTTPFPGLGYVISHTLTARDRHRAFDRARRTAARGELVITDRFPLPEIHTMDSARCDALPGLAKRPLARWLAGVEAGYYSRITRPDQLVVLRVDPTVAVERRPEQDKEFVARRAAEVWDFDWSVVDGIVIDASLPHDEVLSAVVDVIWTRV